MEYHLLNLFDNGSHKLPDFSFSCKFLLIESKTETWLILGPHREYRYHALLLQKFCSDFRIASEWVKKPDLVEICDGDYKTVGGGLIVYDRKNKHVRFAGESTAYGRFDKQALSAFLDSNSSFAGCSISVETGWL